MQIGIDARLPYYRSGGISRYVVQLVAALSSLEDGHQYTVFQSHRDRVDRVPDERRFLRRNLWTPCHHRFEPWLMTIELFWRKLDILHSPDFIPPQRGARRHVITVHDLNFIHYPQFLTRESLRYYGKQIAWAIDHADCIIADSEHTRQDLINLLGAPSGKIKTIHLAADPFFAQMAAKTDDTETQQTLRKHELAPGFVLFVGTIEPRKNIPTLLAAFDRLRQEHSRPPSLVLVGGEGWLSQAVFESIDTLGLKPHVRQLGSVDDRELAHLYLSAGLLAQPSYYEGFGLPALEAMHCRCPVLASDRASLPEVVGDAGILLDPDDVEAWTASMRRVLTDTSLRSKMIGAGIEQANRFSWRKTAEATRSVYEQLS